MKVASTTSLVGSLLLAGALTSLPLASSHGGTYRGPGDTVPPAAGVGSPIGPGNTPVSPAGRPPTTPGVGVPGPPTPGTPVSPGEGTGVPRTGFPEIGQDLTGWSFWWEFNKDPYLNLKSAIYSDKPRTGTGNWFLGIGQGEDSRDSMKPSASDIQNKIVPALLRALETETNPDIITGAMMALAKIGDIADETGNSKFVELFTPFLSGHTQEINETAAIAIGILANDSSVAILRDLLEDSKEGRALVGSNEVNYRTRAFAAYGLALVGSRTGEEAIRQSIFSSLRQTLESDDSSTRDIKVACLISMGLAPMEKLGFDSLPLGDPSAITSRSEQIEYLMEYFQDKKNSYFVRAHAPTAICRLLEGTDNESAKTAAAAVFIESLAKASKRQVQQSCVIALGLLGDTDPDGIDNAIRAALIQTKDKISDTQTRNFAAVALAQSGSRMGTEAPDLAISQVSKHFMVQLSRGKNAIRPWTAIAIGILGKGLGDAAPVELREALDMKLRAENSPLVAAYAIGSGILGNVEFTEPLLEKLERIADDEARGYICVALGMIGATEAIVPINDIIKDSSYRPQLLRQAAIALGLLGDKNIVDELVDTLEATNSLATQAALSSALGFIGDKRSIAPLVDLLENQGVTASARGFAAVALGIVADKEYLPWNSKIATDLNYRASTVTLNDQEGNGILNIL
jgi:HEAT repeat protein